MNDYVNFIIPFAGEGGLAERIGNPLCTKALMVAEA